MEWKVAKFREGKSHMTQNGLRTEPDCRHRPETFLFHIRQNYDTL